MMGHKEGEHEHAGHGWIFLAHYHDTPIGERDRLFTLPRRASHIHRQRCRLDAKTESDHILVYTNKLVLATACP